MKKKKFIISFILCFFIVLLIVFGTYFLLKHKEIEKQKEEEEKIKNAKIIVDLKDNMNAEFLSVVKVSDFIENINGKIKDDYVIDTKELGEREVNFEYINEDGIKIKQSYKINVVDTVPPLVRLGGSYSVNVNSKDTLTEDILCGDNYDSRPKCEIIGDYNLNSVGTYPLVFKATDSSGNVTEKNFNLNVVRPSGGSSNTRTTVTYFEDVVKKYKNENTEIGIDISEWQDYPDFNKLKEAGVEFVILRVGGTKYYTGEYFLDKSFLYNIEKANEVGIPVGIYFYSYAKNKEAALKDAEWIYEQIKDKKVDLPIAFDWENWSFYNSFGLSFYELTDMANSHLNFFKEKGYDGLLYSSKGYLEDIWLEQDFPVWMAHYTKDIELSSYSGEYSYWQLCSDGKVDGINGSVDINVRYKN